MLVQIQCNHKAQIRNGGKLILIKPPAPSRDAILFFTLESGYYQCALEVQRD